MAVLSKDGGLWLRGRCASRPFLGGHLAPGSWSRGGRRVEVSTGMTVHFLRRAASAAVQGGEAGPDAALLWARALLALQDVEDLLQVADLDLFQSVEALLGFFFQGVEALLGLGSGRGSRGQGGRSESRC
jgi:hypothetical protein